MSETVPQRPVVLFLCTHNAARSVMAEAILRHEAGDRFEAHSAGLEPTSVHPLTLRTLEARGIDASGLRSKPISEFLARRAVHFAIVVCEHAAERCPTIYPFAMSVLKWPFPDPSRVEGSEAARLEAFAGAFDAIRARILAWLAEAPERRAQRLPLG